MHELSHLFMARALLDVTKYKIKLYPHRVEYDSQKFFRWASVEYWINKLPSPKQQFAVSMAPRIMNIVACIMLPLGALLSFSTLYLVAWYVFWASGLIDFAYGSLGSSAVCDTMKAARAIDVNSGIIKIFGLIMVIASVLITLITNT